MAKTNVRTAAAIQISGLHDHSSDRDIASLESISRPVARI